MEKQTFYEKLKQLKPIVKAYFDTKKIADTPERLYLLEKCGTSKPSFATDSIKSEEINSLKKTQKILTIVLGLAMVWGVVCAIIMMFDTIEILRRTSGRYEVSVFFLVQYY